MEFEQGFIKGELPYSHGCGEGKFDSTRADTGTDCLYIEQTKAFIANKYKQLGTDWNDKKYRELGDAVSECNKALMNIYKVLLQSQKYVAALAKSLQEYERVNMYGASETDNAFIQGLRDMCHNGDSCHVAAPRGSKTGTQGLKGAKERSVIPQKLCEHIVDICEE